jgi:hypothetical protein
MGTDRKAYLTGRCVGKGKRVDALLQCAVPTHLAAMNPDEVACVFCGAVVDVYILHDEEYPVCERCVPPSEP